jgi:predicted membrane metal-binding protein
LGIVFLHFSYMAQWKIVWLIIAIILLIQPNGLLRNHYPISYFITPAP